jgi:molecular chaperone DnaK
MPQIEVTFDLDANGILNVSAKDKATGKQQSIIIKASSGLSEDEIAQMVRDAESHAEEDRKFEELVTVRNHADGLIHATRKTLTDAADKVDANEKAAIEKAIEELESVIKGDNKDAIEAKTKALSDASANLAQKLYAEQQAGSAPGAQGAQDSNEARSADDAVDAEFEEVDDAKK